MVIPKISVIVPVYNAEKYVANCIESVLRQTYTNFELLMIVDGATDNSAEVCRKYAEIDSRIAVVEKANEGVSKTRNRGLAIASGDYVCFIDADDRVSEYYLEKLLKAVMNADAQIAFCQYAYERDLDIIPSGEPIFEEYSRECDSLYEKYIRLLYRIDGAGYILGSACRSIFLRKMIHENNIVFPPCKLFEDQLFLLEAMAKCEKIATVNEVLYYYNDSVLDSAVRKPYKTGLLKDQLIYLSNLKLRLEDLPLTAVEQKTVWQYATLNVRKLLMTNSVMNPDSDYCKKEICEIRKSCVFEENIPIGVCFRWFASQPLKTKGAEIMLRLHMYSLLRKLRNR